MLVIFVGWQIVGMIPLGIALFMKVADGEKMVLDIAGMIQLLGTNLFLFLMLVSFLFGLIATFFTARVLHGQSITSLTTSRNKIDWKRISFAFVIWGSISVVLIGVDIYLAPDDYVLNFNLRPFLLLCAIVVLLIPFQTSFEEYFLRGYLMQGIGLLAKNRWLPLMITSLIFGLLHFANPEVEKLGLGIMVFYIGTGLFLGILTLMDEGLELAIGFHAANNMITALLVTADWTAFQTDSVYKDVSEPVLDWTILLPVLVVYPIMLLVFSKKYRWTDWKERLTGKVPQKELFLTKHTDETRLPENP
jgi:membrane protease YdiL (CAAX protease family)